MWPLYTKENIDAKLFTTIRNLNVKSEYSENARTYLFNEVRHRRFEFEIIDFYFDVSVRVCL